MRIILVLSLTLLISGCSVLSTKSNGRSLYILESQYCTDSEKVQSNHQVLLVTDTLANPNINSTKILFMKEPLTLGSYQFSAWAEPPPSRLTSLLVEKLECQNGYKQVIRKSSQAEADLALNSEILDFYHDARTEPGQVVIKIRFELTDLRTRKVLMQKTLSASNQLERFDAEGAVLAFNRALGFLLNTATAELNSISKPK